MTNTNLRLAAALGPLAAALGLSALILPFAGCAKPNRPDIIDTADALEVVKEHVEENKERLHLEWVERYPPGVKGQPLKDDPGYSHECFVWVYSGPMSTKTGKPALQKGMFIVGRNKETKKWEITSGEVPIKIELKRIR